MTVRIDLKTKIATSMDNIVSKQGDIVKFNDIAELDPPIPERMALLKLCAYREVVPDIGMRIDEDIFIVQEL